MRQLLPCCAAFALVVACDDSAPTIHDAPTGDDGGRLDGGGDAPVTLPRTLDLGLGDCGGSASATFTVTNSGAANVDLAFTSSDPAFTITPAQVTVIAGTSTTFTVAATIPAGVNAGTPLAATLTATTSIPGHATEQITVAATSRGAAFAISPPSVNFGDVALGDSRSLTFVASNTGNGPVTAAVAAPQNGDFAVTFGTAGTAALGPGDLVTGTVRYTPSGVGTDGEALALTLGGGVRCGTAPATLRLSGTGTTVGGVLVHGGPVDFGDVACGTSAGTATFTLENTGSTARTFTAVMATDPEGDDARYTVSPAGGSIPAGGTVTLTVTRLAVARPFVPRALDAAVHLAVGATSVDVPVHQTLRGPFLTTSATAQVDFGYQPGESTTDAPLRVTNTGNAMATLSSIPSGPFAAILPATLAAGAGADAALRFEPVSQQPVTGSVTIDAGGACSLPVAVDVAGGDGPYADVTAATSAAGCPAPTTMSTSLAIWNPGTQALTISCAEDVSGGPSGLAPTFTPTSATVPAGGSGSIAIDHGPGAGHAGTTTAAIRCTTNEPLTNTRDTTLDLSLTGVELVLAAPAPLDFRCNTVESRTFTTDNVGNQTAFVSPLTDIIPPLSLVFDGNGIAPGGQTVHTVEAYGGSGLPFLLGGADACATATGSGGLLWSGTIGVSSGSGACGVAPAALPVQVFDYFGTARKPRRLTPAVGGSPRRPPAR